MATVQDTAQTSSFSKTNLQKKADSSEPSAKTKSTPSSSKTVVKQGNQTYASTLPSYSYKTFSPVPKLIYVTQPDEADTLTAALVG